MTKNDIKAELARADQDGEAAYQALRAAGALMVEHFAPLDLPIAARAALAAHINAIEARAAAAGAANCARRLLNA
jgi:hypothetical protein